MSSETAWEADVLPEVTRLLSLLLKQRALRRGRIRMCIGFLFLKYAIPAWLSIIVNCYDDKNRDAIVYSLTEDIICITGAVGDEPIIAGNE